MARKNIRKISIKSKIGQTERPLLYVFRSNKAIYAQIIDLKSAKILLSVNSLKIQEKKNKTQIAEIVGQKLAEKAKEIGISQVVFNRRGYKYHGRVAALADSARKNGLKF